MSFNSKTLDLLSKIKGILHEYAGVPITVRQMFYRLVAANIIENNQRQYARISRVLTKARKCGYLSPIAFVDRTRVTRRISCWCDLPEFFKTVRDAYHRDPWIGQEIWPEVWLEKEALGSLFEPVCRKLSVMLCITRGRPSFSFMYDAQERWRQREQAQRVPTILYFGDFDPTGVAIPKNIKDEWTAGVTLARLNVICLTEDQAANYPSSFVKETDPNTPVFVERYGERCVELDAVPPTELQELVEHSINALIDDKAWKKSKVLELQEIVKLGEIIDNYELD